MDQEKEMIDFIKYLSLTKGLMDATVEQYIKYYRMMDHSKVFCQDYVNEFIQDHKNHSVVRGMILNLLALRKLDKLIDMPPKRSGSAKRRLVRGVSLTDIHKLTNYLYRQEFKKGLMFELIYQGALRRVEIPTIRINSFKWMEWFDNMEKPCQLIVLGKRDKERTVLINSETTEKIFKRYFEKYSLNSPEKIERFTNSGSLIFPKLKEDDVYNIIHRESKRCLGRDIRPHELRHARATELEKIGVQIRDIKVYLGHSNLATTEIYLHKSDRESIDNIQEIINKRERKSE